MQGRAISPSAVCITLRRLEERGLVSSKLEAATSDERGRPRRVFNVEPAGLRLLREYRRAFGNLWSGMEALDDA